jgi:hypothetical protein
MLDDKEERKKDVKEMLYGPLQCVGFKMASYRGTGSLIIE